VAEKLSLAHISSGDIFRENLKAQTDLGKLAQTFMDRGELVPDDVTISMIEDRLQRPDCSSGAVLDGFPRTPAQADALKEMLKKLDGEVVIAPFINVPSQVLVERLSGRWSCRSQGHVFHTVYNPPKEPGICDHDGSELYQREDDKPETVKRRIDVYSEQTAPLLEYYTKAGLLVEVDGTRDIDLVTADLLNAINRI
jgi:adenylate kinase